MDTQGILEVLGDKTIIAGVFTILGAAIGGAISFFTASRVNLKRMEFDRKRLRYTEEGEACLAFLDACHTVFIDTLSGFQSKPFYEGTSTLIRPIVFEKDLLDRLIRLQRKIELYCPWMFTKMSGLIIRAVENLQSKTSHTKEDCDQFIQAYIEFRQEVFNHIRTMR